MKAYYAQSGETFEVLAVKMTSQWEDLIPYDQSGALDEFMFEPELKHLAAVDIGQGETAVFWVNPPSCDLGGVELCE